MEENYINNYICYSINPAFFNSDNEINIHQEKYSPVPIKLPEAGIPEEQYEISPVKNDVICPICKYLIWNVVECKNCGKLFCKYCIEEKKLQSRDYCPLCECAPFVSSDSKAIKKFFDNIKLKCPNQECEKLIDYNDYKDHLEKCEFRLYQCNNEGCDYKNIKEYMEDHSDNCEYKTIQCPRCHSQMTRGDYNSKHYSLLNDNVDCLKAQVEFYKKEEENLKNEIKSLKEKDDKNNKEINQLKQKLSEWEKSFIDIYNKLIPNSQEKEEKNQEDNNSSVSIGDF